MASFSATPTLARPHAPSLSLADLHALTEHKFLAGTYLFHGYHGNTPFLYKCMFYLEACDQGIPSTAACYLADVNDFVIVLTLNSLHCVYDPLYSNNVVSICTVIFEQRGQNKCPVIL